MQSPTKPIIPNIPPLYPEQAARDLIMIRDLKEKMNQLIRGKKIDEEDPLFQEVAKQFTYMWKFRLKESSLREKDIDIEEFKKILETAIKNEDIVSDTQSKK